jgi:hypothetical protein
MDISNPTDFLLAKSTSFGSAVTVEDSFAWMRRPALSEVPSSWRRITGFSGYIRMKGICFHHDGLPGPVGLPGPDGWA